jgi:hypothetical protein
VTQLERGDEKILIVIFGEDWRAWVVWDRRSLGDEGQTWGMGVAEAGMTAVIYRGRLGQLMDALPRR